MKFTPAASTRTRACPAAGTGTGTSSKLRASAPPYAFTRIAFTVVASRDARLYRGAVELRDRSNVLVTLAGEYRTDDPRADCATLLRAFQRPAAERSGGDGRQPGDLLLPADAAAVHRPRRIPCHHGPVAQCVRGCATRNRVSSRAERSLRAD